MSGLVAGDTAVVGEFPYRSRNSARQPPVRSGHASELLTGRAGKRILWMRQFLAKPLAQCRRALGVQAQRIDHKNSLGQPAVADVNGRGSPAQAAAHIERRL